MAPQRKFEFVIVKLAFVPKLNTECPEISLTEESHLSNPYIPHGSSWFGQIMRIEMPSVSNNLEQKYCEWDIKTAGVNLFTVGNNHFPNILVVLGVNYMYWLYYHNDPDQQILKGSCRMTEYCSCCIDTQYADIIRRSRLLMKTGRMKPYGGK